LEKFIDEYAADNIYWYFPKGGTADTDEFREKFRIFQSFEGEEWTPELQGRFLRHSTKPNYPSAKPAHSPAS
jgi:hypothetical protein